jgi:adenylate cyclase
VKFELSGRRADARAAWSLVGDTDYLNRVAGNGRMASVDIQDENGVPVVRGTMEGPLGSRIPFVDREMSWVAGRFLRQVRSFESPAIKSSRFEARLEPDGDGVIPHLSLDLEPANALLRPVLSHQLRGIEAGWRGLLERLPAPGQPAPPVEASALSGPANAALSAWSKAAPSPFVSRFGALLATGNPIELQQLRAFTLADRWGVDREQLLIAMLDGVKAGALELYWSVRCPRCRGQAASSASLSDIADHATCGVCRIETNTDLGANVEVLFATHPGIAPRVEGRFCTMFPAVSPDQRALLDLAAGVAVDELVPLEIGEWRLGVLGPAPEVPVHAATDGADVVQWRASSSASEARVRAGQVRLEATNDSARALKVQILSDRPADDRVPAALVTTLPQFRRQMGHQVLSTGTRISVRNVAILFTDLTGSTAMYEEAGDAEAYAIVRDHFDVLRAVVEAHQGVIVKTIGDAIMAAFHTSERAMNAAFAMQAAFVAWTKVRPGASHLGLRVGFHVGPALTVHTDGSGIDYFGRTVNIAARTQGSADGGMIVWTDGVHADPSVSRLLADRGIAAEGVDVALKGLRGSTRLYRTSIERGDRSA